MSRNVFSFEEFYSRSQIENKVMAYSNEARCKIHVRINISSISNLKIFFQVLVVVIKR